MGESVVGSSHGAADDLCSLEVGLKRLISRGSSKTSTSLSSASTHSESLVFARFDIELTNDFIMDKGPMYCSFNDHLATPMQFSCLGSLTHKDVCDQANVVATWHITLFSEIWLRLEHSELVKGKLERRLVRRDEALEKRDVEIEHL
ncbi:hypothetical protein Tco_0063236 [Tanacetum coccineum]